MSKSWLGPGLCAALALAGCRDPLLTLQSISVLLVGQQATVEVVEGGSGSDLLDQTLELVDSASNVYGAGSAELEVKRLSENKLQFVVPPGIATGVGQVSVTTSKGPTFSGSVTINRAIGVRDLSGKVWVVVLLGDGTAAQFAEAAGNDTAGFGAGYGLLSIGYKGRLLASVVRDTGALRLAWIGSTLKPSDAYTFDSAVKVRDVLVAPSGQTLVATSNGTYVVEKPTADPPAKPSLLSTVLSTGSTVALAVASKANRAVAVSDPGVSGKYALYPIDLGTSPPTVLTALKTNWAGGSGAVLRVGTSPDGKRIVVVDGTAGKLALFTEGATTPAASLDLPASQTGTVAVASNKDGSVFFLANKTGKNVSRAHVSGSTVSFDTPITEFGASAQSGVPMGLAASTGDEVVLLLERDLVLLTGTTQQTPTAKALALPYLFKDKVGGEIGGTVTIQP